MVSSPCLFLVGALTFPFQQLAAPVVQDAPLPPHALARFGTASWRLPDEIHQLAWSPDGKILVARSEHLIALNAVVGKQLFEATPKRDGNSLSPINILFALSGDGKLLAVTTQYLARVDFVDAQTGKPRGRLSVDNSQVNVAVALSPDGRYLAMCDWLNKITLWETTTGNRIRDMERSGPIFAFGAGGKTLIVAGEKQVRVLDVATGKEVRSLQGGGRALALSADGRRLAVLGNEAIRFWDPGTGKKFGEIALPAKSVGPSSKVVLSANGNSVLCHLHCHAGLLLAWDVNTGKELFKYKLDSWWNPQATALSPDGRILAWSQARTIRRWDLAAGKELLSSPGHEQSVHSLSFLADGKTLTSWAWEDVRFWTIAPVPGGERKPPLTTFAVAAFSADGRFLAQSELGKHLVTIQDLATDKTSEKVVQMSGGWGLCRQLALSPDGKYLAASMEAVTHRDDPWGAVWDLTTGKELYRWKNRFFRGGFSFTADGKHLVLREHDHLRLWDLAAMKEVRSFRRHDWDAVELFTPDSKFLTLSHGNRFFGGR